MHTRAEHSTQKRISISAKHNRGRATYELILRAAVTEFGSSGFTGGSMRTIARACNTPLAVVQHHFGDKLALWHAVLAEVMGGFGDQWQNTHARLQGEPAAAIVAHFIESLVRHAATRPEFVAIAAQARMGSSPDARLLILYLSGTTADILRLIDAAQRDGSFIPGDPRMVFHMMIGAALSMFQAAADARETDLDVRDPSVIENYIQLCTRTFMPLSPAASRASQFTKIDFEAHSAMPEVTGKTAKVQTKSPSLFYLLTSVSDVLRKSLNEDLQALGLTAAQMIALVRIAGGRRVSATKLARLLAITPQSATDLVRNFETRGLITRHQSVNDHHRALEIKMTKDGARVLEALRKVVAMSEHHIVAPLSMSEVDLLRDALRKLLEHNRPLTLTEWTPLL